MNSKNWIEYPLYENFTLSGINVKSFYPFEEELFLSHAEGLMADWILPNADLDFYQKQMQLWSDDKITQQQFTYSIISDVIKRDTFYKNETIDYLIDDNGVAHIFILPKDALVIDITNKEQLFKINDAIIELVFIVSDFPNINEIRPHFFLCDKETLIEYYKRNQDVSDADVIMQWLGIERKN